MNPRRRAAALWGLVGAMAFLALHQGYVLFGGRTLSVPVIALVTVLVGVTSGVTAYWFDRRLAAQNESV